MALLEEMIAAGDLSISGVLLAGVRSAGQTHISPGLSLDLGATAARMARFRALELNAALPSTRSVPWIREEDCELVINSDVAPPASVSPEPDEIQHQIGRNVAGLVASGMTIELGVGQALLGVASALIKRGEGFRINIHTGLITDDVRRLVEAETIKGSFPGTGGASIVATGARGSADFYAWLSENPEVLMVDSSRAHRIRHLSSLDNFMAINSAGHVDLLGNVGAIDRAGAVGGGGLPDFALAGVHSAGSVIAIASRNRHGGSKIVPTAEYVQLHGTAVTHVVTEHGVAYLKGATAAERTRRMIGVAHPEDRPTLVKLAEALP
jgi:4-hydroxybutyrate CoA-transferase